MKIYPAYYALFALLPTVAWTDTQPVTQYHAQTGKVRFISGEIPTSDSGSAARSTNPQPLSPLEHYAPLFGINDVDEDLQLSRTSLPQKRRVQRYQQRYNGLPVIGGELIVNSDQARKMFSMSGEVSPDLSIKSEPSLSALAAQKMALSAVEKWYGIDRTTLTATDPVLSIYDPRLVSPSDHPSSLVWQLEITAPGNHSVREFVLVDAANGAIRLHFNQTHTARNRLTYSAKATTTRPGTLVCDESQPNCTDGDDADADAAHDYSGDTYDFYFQQHGRDSLDNAGMDIISTVDFNDSNVCPNAFWDGAQMTYCDGFSLADDVVAHELTHGVTNFSSNLLYYYQSGAINESFSDIWGEFVDLTNGKGNDSSAVRWQLGEDLSGGAIRNMQDPGLFNNPDRITSPNYFTGSEDNGGVHINSGVNNKAATLMVDGGTFNGFSITPLGIDKTAAVYYETQTNLLTTGSDYADLFDAMNQACQNVTGTVGITETDCDQVRNALLAVEMDQGNIPGLHTEAAICPNNLDSNTMLFSDDMESGTAQWTFQSLTGSISWNIQDEGYATSGVNVLFDNSDGTLLDNVAEIKDGIIVPRNTTAYLHFSHAFFFEVNTSTSTFFDGGFIEYTIDDGINWIDAGSLIEDGVTYNGAISSTGNNPNPSHPAFVSSSITYVSSRLSLASLAGQTVRFRWRTSNDSSVVNVGWIIDDVQIYTCIDNALPTANAGSDQIVFAGSTVSLNASASTTPENPPLTFAWLQTAGPSVTLSDSINATPSFTAPAAPATLTFSLTVTDAGDAQDTDTVTIVVMNSPPLASAGNDQTVNVVSTVSLDASASTDPDSQPLTFAWSQIAGTPVILSDNTDTTPDFTAPIAASTLVFSVTATDTNNTQDTDTVTIDVVNTPPIANAGVDLSVNVGTVVLLNASFSVDPENQPLTYAWSQIAGTPVTLSDNTNISPSFSAPVSPTTLTFSVAVTDSGNAQNSDTVTIDVIQPVADNPGQDGGGSALGFGALLALLLKIVFRRKRQYS